MAIYELKSAKTGRTYKADFASDPSDEDVDFAIDSFDAEEPTESKEKSFFGLGDTASALAEIPSELYQGIPVALRRMKLGLQDPSNYSPEDTAVFEAENQRQAVLQQEQEAREARGENTSVGDAFRGAVRSLPFSVSTMVPSIAAGAGTGAAVGAVFPPSELVTVPVGAIAGTIGGMAAGGAAAYRMAGQQFLDDSIRGLQDKAKSEGKTLSKEELDNAYEVLLPIAENTGLWEAGPEAVGNAVTAGAGKFIFGFGKDLAADVVKRTLGKKIAAAVGSTGVEVGGEAITSMNQGPDQAKAQQFIETGSTEGAPDEYQGLEGFGKALAEVGPTTLATQALMGGLGGGMKIAQKSYEKISGQDAQDPFNPEAPITEDDTSAEDITEADITDLEPPAPVIPAPEEIEKRQEAEIKEAANLKIDAAAPVITQDLVANESPLTAVAMNRALNDSNDEAQIQKAREAEIEAAKLIQAEQEQAATETKTQETPPNEEGILLQQANDETQANDGKAPDGQGQEEVIPESQVAEELDPFESPLPETLTANVPTATSPTDTTGTQDPFEDAPTQGEEVSTQREAVVPASGGTVAPESQQEVTSKAKRGKIRDKGPVEQLRDAGEIGFPMPVSAGGGWFRTNDFRGAFDKIENGWNKVDLLRAVANNRGKKASEEDLRDALVLGKSLLGKEVPDLPSLGWDISMNPAASESLKASALAFREQADKELRGEPESQQEVTSKTSLTESQVGDTGGGMERDTTKHDFKPKEQQSPDEYLADFSYDIALARAEMRDASGKTLNALQKEGKKAYDKRTSENLRQSHVDAISIATGMDEESNADFAKYGMEPPRNPVSSAAVDTYSIKLPEGYKKQGDLYVYSPESQVGDTGGGMTENTEDVDADIVNIVPEGERTGRWSNANVVASELIGSRGLTNFAIRPNGPVVSLSDSWNSPLRASTYLGEFKSDKEAIDAAKKAGGITANESEDEGHYWVVFKDKDAAWDYADANDNLRDFLKTKGISEEDANKLRGQELKSLESEYAEWQKNKSPSPPPTQETWEQSPEFQAAEEAANRGGMDEAERIEAAWNAELRLPGTRDVAAERRAELSAAVAAAEAEPEKPSDPTPGLTFNEMVNQKLPIFIKRATGKAAKLKSLGYVKRGDFYIHPDQQKQQPSPTIPAKEQVDGGRGVINTESSPRTQKRGRPTTAPVDAAESTKTDTKSNGGKPEGSKRQRELESAIEGVNEDIINARLDDNEFGAKRAEKVRDKYQAELDALTQSIPASTIKQGDTIRFKQEGVTLSGTYVGPVNQSGKQVYEVQVAGEPRSRRVTAQSINDNNESKLDGTKFSIVKTQRLKSGILKPEDVKTVPTPLYPIQSSEKNEQGTRFNGPDANIDGETGQDDRRDRARDNKGTGDDRKSTGYGIQERGGRDNETVSERDNSERSNRILEGARGVVWDKLSNSEKQKEVTDFARSVIRDLHLRNTSPNWDILLTDIPSDRPNARITSVSDGKTIVTINATTASSMPASMAPDAESAFAFAYDTMQEEYIHAMHLATMAKSWRNSGSKQSVDAYIIQRSKKAYSEALYAALAAKRSGNTDLALKIEKGIIDAFNLYSGGAKPVTSIEQFDDYVDRGIINQLQFYGEFVRQLSQLNRQDFTTETGWLKFKNMVLGWFNDAINSLKAVLPLARNGDLGPIIQQDIKELESMMRDYRDGKPMEKYSRQRTTRPKTQGLERKAAERHLKKLGVPSSKVYLVDEPSFKWRGRYDPDGGIGLNIAYLNSVEELNDTLLRHEAVHDAVETNPKVKQRAIELLDALTDDELSIINESIQGYSDAEMQDEQIVEAVRLMTSRRPDLRTKWARFVEAVSLAIKKFLGIKNLDRQVAELVAARILARGEARVLKGKMGGRDKFSGNMYSYAGEKAETPQFMRDSLDAAKAMAAAGKSSEEIRAATGWFPGKYDGKMRWEIPDDGARLTQKWKTAKTVGEAINHSALFQAYTKLANVFLDVSFDPDGISGGSFSTFGGVNPATGKPDPDSRSFIDIKATSDSDGLSTLLHEIQHWIQNQEGFAKGGSPDNLVTPQNLTEASRFLDAEKGLAGAEKEIIALQEALTAERSKKSTLGFGGPSKSVISKLDDSLNAASKKIEDIWAYQGKQGIPKGGTKAALLKALNQVERELGSVWMLNDRQRGLVRVYQKLAGEIEARDTQARQYYTPEQRKAVAPYSSENITKEDAIVMFVGSGPQASMNLPTQGPDKDLIRGYAEARASRAAKEVEFEDDIDRQQMFGQQIGPERIKQKMQEAEAAAQEVFNGSEVPLTNEGFNQWKRIMEQYSVNTAGSVNRVVELRNKSNSMAPTALQTELGIYAERVTAATGDPTIFKTFINEVNDLVAVVGGVSDSARALVARRWSPLTERWGAVAKTLAEVKKNGPPDVDTTSDESANAANKEMTDALDEKRRSLLEQDSKALAKLLSQVKGDMKWGDFFTNNSRISQKERQRRIYTQILKHENLRNLSQAERLQLTRELDKAWARARKKVFLREFSKKIPLKNPKLKKKLEAQAPALLKSINLGTFDSQAYRKEIAQTYGLKDLSDADLVKVIKLGAEIQEAPVESLARRKKIMQLADLVSGVTNIPRSHIIASYYISSLLASARTGVGAAFSFVEVLMESFMGVVASGVKSPTQALAGLNAGIKAFPRGVLEGLSHFYTGDKTGTLLASDSFNQYLGGEGYSPVSLGSLLWKEKNPIKKFAGVVIMAAERMLTGIDISLSSTLHEASLIWANSATEFKDDKGNTISIRNPTVADKQRMRDQVIAEEFGGVEPPKTLPNLAKINAGMRDQIERFYINESPDAGMDLVKTGRRVASGPSFQGEVRGAMGFIVNRVNTFFGDASEQFDKWADKKGITGVERQIYAMGVGLLSLGKSFAGMQFFSFVGRLINRNLQFVPGTALLPRVILGSDPTSYEKKIMQIKNAFGLGLIVAAISYITGDDDDDEDKLFGLEGDWSSLSGDQRDAKRTSKALPSSFWYKDQNGSRQYLSFANSSLSWIFSAVANLRELKVNNPEKWNEASEASIAAGGIYEAFKSVLNTSAMGRLGELLGGGRASKPGDVGTGAEQFASKIASFGGGFVPSIIRELDYVMDPSYYEPKTLAERTVSVIPFLRRQVAESHGSLGVLGTPAQINRSPTSRVYSSGADTEAEKILARMADEGLYLPLPDDKKGRDHVSPVSGRKIQMTGPQIREYVKLVGEDFQRFILRDGENLMTMDRDKAKERISDAASKIKTRAARMSMRIRE